MHVANTAQAVIMWQDEMDLCNKNSESPAFTYCCYILSACTSALSFSHPQTHERDGPIWDNGPFIQMEGTPWQEDKWAVIALLCHRAGLGLNMVS